MRWFVLGSVLLLLAGCTSPSDVASEEDVPQDAPVDADPGDAAASNGTAEAPVPEPVVLFEGSLEAQATTTSNTFYVEGIDHERINIRVLDGASWVGRVGLYLVGPYEETMVIETYGAEHDGAIINIAGSYSTGRAADLEEGEWTIRLEADGFAELSLRVIAFTPVPE